MQRDIDLQRLSAAIAALAGQRFIGVRRRSLRSQNKIAQMVSTVRESN